MLSGPNNPPDKLLVIGASARAAAESATRANIACTAIDLFADVDTQNVCETAHQVADLDDAKSLINQINCDAFIYTGCLENRPGLIEQLSLQLPLLGNGLSALHRIRDPFLLSELASVQKFERPETIARSGEFNAANKRWLRKPFRSGGGAGVQFVSTSEQSEQTSDESADEAFYQQQFIDGQSYSAAFVSNSKTCQLLGITKQLTTEVSGSQSTFVYSGNIGPVSLDANLTTEITRIGNSVCEYGNMVGLFGIDLIIREQSVWLIEINPRYTASMELIEASAQHSLIDLHLSACAGMPITWPGDDHGSLTTFCKLIYYLESHELITVDKHFVARLLRADGTDARVHDIPQPGTTIMPGHPFFTVITVDDNPQRALEIARNCASKDDLQT